MVLIADCGGTKTDWCLVDGDKVVKRFVTPGMNAVLMPYDEMSARFHVDLHREIKTQIPEVDEVCFYGAGCVSDNVCKHVRFSLSENLPNARISVNSDMLGTARALCGHTAGIVCILGTGSNSCYYDGERIIDNVASLGYILGDEGSGAYLGKMLVNAVFKRQLPQALCRSFCERYHLDSVSLVQKVYREPSPNRFLASLSPFLLDNIEQPAILMLVTDAFREFFRKNIMPYTSDAEGCEVAREVHFTGSVAYHYSGLIRDVAEEFGYTVGTIVSSPMEGLVAYHTSALL